MEESKFDFQVCTKCVMDTSDKFIVFDDKGVCNHCREYEDIVKKNIFPADIKKQKLEKLIADIKSAGKGKKYDCLAGLSGGMDSSFVIYLAKKYGLRTLIVHFDNGWDSELAIKNIENIVTRTAYDYYNYVVDWDEFRDLQMAYLKASVIDVEIPTDMGIFSLIPKVALKYKIKYVLIGHNLETEFIMGKNWNYTKMDRSNLLEIHKQFGTKKLKTFPNYTPWEQMLYKFRGIKQVNMLWYEECNYTVIRKLLFEEFDWKYYGVKHGESVFTKFYQSYILPKKFGIDKRKAHLSDQINAGHISREKACEILELPVYSSPDEEKREYDYVVKKLAISKDEFDDLMSKPPKSHFDFGVNQPYGNLFDKLLLKIMKIKLLVSGMTRIYRLFYN